MSTATRFYIDSETFNELSHANDELIQFLQWLFERQDLEAINKLKPIVTQATNLIVAVIEGTFPETSHVIEAINLETAIHAIRRVQACDRVRIILF